MLRSPVTFQYWIWGNPSPDTGATRHPTHVWWASQHLLGNYSIIFLVLISYQAFHIGWKIAKDASKDILDMFLGHWLNFAEIFMFVKILKRLDLVDYLISHLEPISKGTMKHLYPISSRWVFNDVLSDTFSQRSCPVISAAHPIKFWGPKKARLVLNCFLDL